MKRQRDVGPDKCIPMAIGHHTFEHLARNMSVSSASLSELAAYIRQSSRQGCYSSELHGNGFGVPQLGERLRRNSFWVPTSRRVRSAPRVALTSSQFQTLPAAKLLQDTAIKSDPCSL
eukprot:s6887_g2.t1